MLLYKLMIAGIVMVALVPAEPDIGFGRPQLYSQTLQSARQFVDEHINEVKSDLAEHAHAAQTMKEVMNAIPDG